jgi:Uma2 family endonuclease
MSTIVNPVSYEPDSEADPWRLGWRYVKRLQPDGTETTEQVPLTERDLLFPLEGDFVVNNDPHHVDCAYLKSALRAYYRQRRPRVLILADHRVDYGVVGLEPLGPDVSVFDDVATWDPHCGTLYIAKVGARPLLAIEVTSPSTRKGDLGEKVTLFEQARIPFYAIVDRVFRQQTRQIQLIGYRLTPQGYVQVQLDDRGWLWLETIELWLGVERERVFLYDPQGNRLIDYEEAIQAVQAEAQARQAAEATAATEAQARQAAEARLRELEEELRRLRGLDQGT